MSDKIVFFVDVEGNTLCNFNYEKTDIIGSQSCRSGPLVHYWKLFSL